MLAIKLSVREIRLLRSASTSEELKGARELVLAKVEQAETLKSFGKEVKAEKRDYFGWKEARDIARTVLGDQVTMPPFPDGAYYRRLMNRIRNQGITAETVQAVSEYARDNMRLPISLDFMVGQSDRIMSGEWAVKKAAPSPAAVWRQDTLPDE